MAEIRVHDQSPFANKTLEESGIYADTGAHIVGQWVHDALDSPPADDALLLPGMILVAAGSPDSIKRLSDIARPITQEGTIVVAGFGDVGSKLVEMLKDADEEVCVIDTEAQSAVDVVGDILDTEVLERAGEIILDIPPSFVLAEDDALYVCGTAKAFELFYED